MECGWKKPSVGHRLLHALICLNGPSNGRGAQKREAQLTRVQDGLLSVVGDLQGIGQDALPALETLAALPAVGGFPRCGGAY